MTSIIYHFKTTNLNGQAFRDSILHRPAQLGTKHPSHWNWKKMSFSMNDVFCGSCFCFQCFVGYQLTFMSHHHGSSGTNDVFPKSVIFFLLWEKQMHFVMSTHTPHSHTVVSFFFLNLIFSWFSLGILIMLHRKVYNRT